MRVDKSPSFYYILLIISSNKRMILSSCFSPGSFFQHNKMKIKLIHIKCWKRRKDNNKMGNNSLCFFLFGIKCKLSKVSGGSSKEDKRNKIFSIYKKLLYCIKISMSIKKAFLTHNWSINRTTQKWCCAINLIYEFFLNLTTNNFPSNGNIFSLAP